MAALDLSSVSSATTEEEETHTIEAVKVQTAFLVYRSDTGETIMDTDVNKPLIIDHSPHPDEVFGMVAKVQADLQTHEMVQATVVNTVNGMMQVAQQQMQQAEQQAQAAQLLNSPNFRNR